jgi:hypothetical protein
MIVILCHPAMPRRCGSPGRCASSAPAVELVTVEELVYSRRIVYRLSDTGSSGSIVLADGRTLRPETITGLVNRVATCRRSTLRERCSGSRLRRSGAQRASARVDQRRRRARHQSAAALRARRRSFPLPALMHFAAMAGLPTGGFRASADRHEDARPRVRDARAVVFDGRTYGTLLPRALLDGCRRFAALTGASLMQIEFNQSPNAASASSTRRPRRLSPRRQAARARPCPRFRTEHGRMILLAGIRSERPLALVAEALEASGADHRCSISAGRRRELRSTSPMPMQGARSRNALIDGESIPLDAITAIYLRLMDDAALPGIAESPPHSTERIHSRRLHELCTASPTSRRARAQSAVRLRASNHSKPFQAQAIRAAGFDIPETLITNDVAAAKEFIERAWSEGGDVIYKSVSGIRSIVRRVGSRISNGSTGFAGARPSSSASLREPTSACTSWAPRRSRPSSRAKRPTTVTRRATSASSPRFGLRARAGRPHEVRCARGAPRPSARRHRPAAHIRRPSRLLRSEP